MTDLDDAQLNDMFQSLDLRQLEELGYVIDSQSPDHLEDFLITIEEEFSDLDRDEKIAELKKVGLDEVQFDAETKRERMKREKAEREMDEASTDVDYMREHYSESDAYIYAYNDGHSDGRSNTVSYRPSASDRELNSFKKIFKQAEFAADSPFNTLLMIREDIIIDDEEDFDRLLSVYMSLETDIAQLYQETSNPKHPLLAEMMRYRNRIANRLDELQEEVAIQDTIEMDAEQQRMSVPFTLEQPLRTGYKLGLGWVAAALTIPLALLGIGALYNQE
jgi:hypothetical protein